MSAEELAQASTIGGGCGAAAATVEPSATGFFHTSQMVLLFSLYFNAKTLESHTHIHTQCHHPCLLCMCDVSVALTRTNLVRDELYYHHGCSDDNFSKVQQEKLVDAHNSND